MNGQRPSRIIIDELSGTPTEVDPDEWCEESARFAGFGTPRSPDDAILSVLFRGEHYEVVIDDTPLIGANSAGVFVRRDRPCPTWRDRARGLIRFLRHPWSVDRGHWSTEPWGLTISGVPISHTPSILDSFPHDYNPDGCWATSDAYDPLDPEAEACDLRAVDALGLCAKHRAEKVHDG